MKIVNGKLKILGVTTSFIFLFASIVFAATFNDDTQEEFSLGTYNGTVWDTDHVELDVAQTSGTFTSKIFDGSESGTVSWDTISWTPTKPYYKELPDAGVSETAYSSGNANMTGNVLLMHFNEGALSTSFSDTSSFSNNGTCSGIACPVSGGVGQLKTSVDFDGSNDLITIPNDDSIDFGTNQDFSISFWFKDSTKSGGSSGPEIIEKQQGGTFYQVRSPNNAGNLKFQIDDGVRQDSFFSSSGDLSDGQWHHVVFVRDYDVSISAYVDGVASGSDTSVSAESLSNTSALQLGQGNSGKYDGQLDELAIWNRALPITEIVDLYERAGSKVRFQVRSCDDSVCLGENFIGPDGTVTDYYEELDNNAITLPSFSLTNISDNRYFQYKIFFDTLSSSFNPELRSASLDYTVTGASDSTPPAIVNDLVASNATENSIQLSWTAPGDDGNTGTATSYDVRYSTSVINQGNWSLASQASGEPSPSVASSNESMTVSGLSAETTYYFAIKISDEVPNESGLSNVSSISTVEASEQGSQEGGEEGGEVEPNITIPAPGSGPGTVPPTTASFSGRAYPGSTVKLLRKSVIDSIYKHVPITDETVDNQGNFSLSYTALLQGNYLFALRVKDKEGRESGIISFDANLRSNSIIEASDIFVPPTLGFKKSVVQRGKNIIIVGNSYPNSSIEALINGIIVGEAIANSDGEYVVEIETGNLEFGQHYARVSQTDHLGIKSDFSYPTAFKISKLLFPESDLNGDDEVDITDWSIFLFRWSLNDSTVKKTIDMDENSEVDIKDLSIFLNNMRI